MPALIDKLLHFKSIFKNAFVNVRKLIGVPVIFFVIYLMLMIPIANLGLSSVLTKNIYIPKFLTEELMKTTKGIIIYGTFMIAVFILNFKLIFTLPLTILNRQSLFKNMRLSWQITKRNKFRLVIEIVILELIIGAILTLIISGATYLAICVDEEGDKFLVSSIFICCIEKRIVLLLFIYEIIINQCVSTALKTRECIRPTGLRI